MQKIPTFVSSGHGMGAPLFFVPLSLMKVVDRTVAPPLREIEKIDLLEVKHFQLSNGMPAWCINAGTQDVIKIELLFNAGRWQEPKRAIAATVAKMLMEGTQKKSAQQIAEEVEFYGATINSDAVIDYSSVSIFTLNKHLHSLLPLLHEVIYEASFPEKELVTHVQNSKQRLLVNLEKVDFLAHKEFNERLYGKEHPNGYTTSVEDYAGIDVSALRQFHQSAYQQGSFKIFLSGKISDAALKEIDRYFGSKIPSHPNGSSAQHITQPDLARKFFVEKKDAVQSAIRMGKAIINKTHPDFPKLRVLNTVLGGYFGSRLMQNLREEKGYC
ncbi:MAG: M16 family metallopeptidase, partial [Chitinophagales bacterium]